MAKMTRAEAAARLAKLEVLADRSPFAGEREAAREKIKQLRDILGMPEPRLRSSSARVRYVDVGDAPNLKAAFKKAFQAAFDDIREMMRENSEKIDAVTKQVKANSDMLDQFKISMKVRLK